jgi:hypothetical protein
MNTTLSRLPKLLPRACGWSRIPVAVMVVLAAAAAISASEVRAGNLVQRLASPGVIQVLSGDLDGDGVSELVTLNANNFVPAVHVYRRSDSRPS